MEQKRKLILKNKKAPVGAGANAINSTDSNLNKIIFMANEKKSYIGWFVLAFFVGIVLAGWGWDKNESTIAARTVGAVPMIVIGCVLIVGGLIGFFATGKNKV